MKKSIGRLTLIALLSVLVCCICIAAHATEITPIDYTALFDRAETVDGYLTDAYAIELADTYEQAPEQFITALSSRDESTIDNIAFMLSVEYQFRNPNQLNTTLNEISESATTQELSAISSILSHLEDLDSSHSDTSEQNEYDFPDRTFNVDVVKQTIINRLEVNRTLSGEFSSYVSMVYQLSPTLFAEMISDFPAEDITLLANCIACDMSQQNTTPPAVTSDSTTLNILQSQIQSSLQNQDELIVTQVAPSLESGVELLANTTIKPTSVLFNYVYSRDYAYVGDSVQINVTFTTNKPLSSLIVFHVKLYQFINGSYQVISTQNVAAVPGSYNGSFTYTDSFTEPGGKNFLLKIYESSGTTCLYTTGSTALSIVGRWSISIDLPEYRWDLGYLTLYDPYGVSAQSDICLGGSWLNNGINEPTQVNGNTPTGVYTGYLDGPFTPYESYGTHKVIRLIGVSGEIMQCTNRSGFLIHGGRDGQASSSRPFYPLYPTNGCVRVSSDFQYTLQQTISNWLSVFDYLDADGDITITEYPTVTIPST